MNNVTGENQSQAQKQQAKKERTFTEAIYVVALVLFVIGIGKAAFGLEVGGDMPAIVWLAGGALAVAYARKRSTS